MAQASVHEAGAQRRMLPFLRFTGQLGERRHPLGDTGQQRRIHALVALRRLGRLVGDGLEPFLHCTVGKAR